MILCPHCQGMLKRKERSGRRCLHCQKVFALEPKENALGLFDLKLRKKAKQLGLGGFKYTAGQLQLVVTKRPSPPDSAAWFALGILLFVGLGIAGSSWLVNRDPGLAQGLKWVGGGLVAFGALMALIVLLSRRPKVTSAAVFEQQILAPWREVYGAPPPGLIEPAELAATASAERPTEGLRGVVVCPQRDVLTAFLANGVPGDLKVGLLSLGPPADAWETQLLAQLRSQPQLPILLLHDASAAGVVLARDLPGLLGLDPAHKILDLGLNVKKSISKKRLTLFSRVPSVLKERLKSGEIGVDVRATRAVRRGRTQVAHSELTWLLAGNCSPIMAVPPGSLVKRLQLALRKLDPKRRVPVPRVEQASLGFMHLPV